MKEVPQGLWICISLSDILGHQSFQGPWESLMVEMQSCLWDVKFTFTFVPPWKFPSKTHDFHQRQDFFFLGLLVIQYL